MVTQDPVGIPQDETASPELCQLVWLDDALTPLNAFEMFLRFAKLKGRGALRRVGIVAYGPLDEHRTPPWRRAIVAMATAGGSKPDDGAGGAEGPGGGSGSGVAGSDEPRAPRVRVAALHAVGRIGGAEQRSVVAPFVVSPSRDVRTGAVRALAALGAEEWRPLVDCRDSLTE